MGVPGYSKALFNKSLSDSSWAVSSRMALSTLQRRADRPLAGPDRHIMELQKHAVDGALRQSGDRCNATRAQKIKRATARVASRGRAGSLSRTTRTRGSAAPASIGRATKRCSRRHKDGSSTCWLSTTSLGSVVIRTGSGRRFLAMRSIVASTYGHNELGEGPRTLGSGE